MSREVELCHRKLRAGIIGLENRDVKEEEAEKHLSVLAKTHALLTEAQVVLKSGDPDAKTILPSTSQE
jgi:hypothetical protein